MTERFFRCFLWQGKDFTKQTEFDSAFVRFSFFEKAKKVHIIKSFLGEENLPDKEDFCFYQTIIILYLCRMKTKLHFTRGEWVAALTLLALIFSSYLFYYEYQPTPKVGYDFEKDEKEIEAFIREQDRLRDSMERSRSRYQYAYFPGYGGDTNPRKGRSEKPMLYEIVKIDLNRCDSTDIMVVPQFGAKRAARLVEYRDRLGGFYSLEQLHEVYVLQNMDLAFLEKYFKVSPQNVHKINVNTATYGELVRHPYFDAYLAKTIIAHRSRQGNIHSLEELRQITHAYPELMDKLKHYVVFE